MTTAERAILEILLEHGPTEVWHVDRWFTARRVGGFAPGILSELVARGWVTLDAGGRYAISALGRESLDREAA